MLLKLESAMFCSISWFKTCDFVLICVFIHPKMLSTTENVFLYHQKFRDRRIT